MKSFLTLALLSLTAAPALAQQAPPLPALSSEGRFLYANDDDWDWATPLGANVPCGLSVYGKMSWSALDWMEEGLPEVRGVLVGTPPLLGNYLTMGDLNRFRGAGPKLSYEQLPHKPEALVSLLRDKKAPNVVILMQDVGVNGGPHVTAQEAAAVYEFVSRGGRVLVLDDWSFYRVLVTPFLDDNKFRPLDVPALAVADRTKALEHINRLGDDKFAVREMAFAELVKMGPAIVPVLEEAKPLNEEQNIRIQKLLTRLKPPPLKVADGDGWMLDAAKRAGQLHKHGELKGIIRNGQMAPGHALCIRLPVVKKGK